MLELPKQGEGLDWIVAHWTSQLLLIPGLQPASIIAAAAGDAEALAYLRFTAQHQAAVGSCSITPLDAICSAAKEIDDQEELRESCSRYEEHEKLYQVYQARHNFTMNLMAGAAEAGCLAALQWLRALCHQMWDIDEAVMEAAASHGHLEVLKHLRSGPSPVSWPDSILSKAVGHADCLEWLLAQEPPCPYDEELLNEAAAAGNLPALQHLRLHHQKFMPLTAWDDSVTCSAAEEGHLAVLQWLRRLVPPVPWDAHVCRVAAERGNMAMLLWVHGQDPPAPWDSHCISAAAREGNLSMLQWLHGKGCPCDASVMRQAARAGRLDMLQWLRQQHPPCPWDESCMQAAASHPREAMPMLEWLHTQVPPAPWAIGCTLAAAGNSLAVLEWLLSQDPPCPLHPACPQPAARRGDLPMLELLSRYGCMPTGTEYYTAAKHGQRHVLRWLHQKRVPAPVAAHLATQFGGWLSWGPMSMPVLLFLGDIGASLHPEQHSRLLKARKACCTFHGLVRWCRQAVSDPSKGINRAFDALSTNAAGQSLLVRLSLLPPEIVSKIALAAGLQHNLFEASGADDLLHPPRRRNLALAQ